MSKVPPSRFSPGGMADEAPLSRRQLAKQKPRAVALSIVKDVACEAGRYSATSEMPWLRIDFDGPIPAGQWIRLTFLASLLDPLCRPLLRAITDDGHSDAILPGALFGRGIWLGRLPQGTREVLISPTNRPGRFGFSIERIEIVSRAVLLGLCLCRNPLRALIAIAARLAGLRFLADLQFRRALSATSLRDYEAWRRKRWRELDTAELEAPRFDWKSGPCIVYLVAGEPDPAALLRSLGSQPYPNWRLVAVGRSPLRDAAKTAAARIIAADADQAVDEVLDALPTDSLLASLPTGGESLDYALIALAEVAIRNADADIFYGDEEHLGPRGRSPGLELKPDWSPRFHSTQNYLGNAVFIRAAALRRLSGRTILADLMWSRDKLVRALLAEGCEVQHVRRVLLATPAGTRPEASLRQDAKEPPVTAWAGPRASIILPTRDRRDMLEPCVRSLQTNLLGDDIELIIVDNGSVDEDAIRFLSGLSSDRRIRILSRPGSFNFSALCNDAAQAASAPTLIFLNNDTEILHETRIEPLLSSASEPDVGAVGAKLLYPDGRLQHAGIVLGTDGYAGHFERGIGREDAGYFGRLCVTHEISAVTAACLAVEKRKFAAVGGFDCVHLPVEFNDIDLCLRLAERGWKTICACECVLIHRESRSRGATLQPDRHYRAEHASIHARWINKLRDDPYFHPALSLDSLSARLG